MPSESLSPFQEEFSIVCVEDRDLAGEADRAFSISIGVEAELAAVCLEGIVLLIVNVNAGVVGD